MKKWISVLLAAAICFSFSAFAEKTAKGSFGGKDMFSIRYDENLYQYDDEYYNNLNTQTSEWQFMLWKEDVAITCTVEYWREWKNYSTFQASDAENMEYFQTVMEDSYSDCRSEFIETYRVNVSNGSKTASLPFLIYMVEYGEGDVTYFAETVTHGYSIYFEVFDSDNGGEKDSRLQLIHDILNTFQPL